MSKQGWIYLIIFMLLVGGPILLHVQFIVILQDVPFLLIGFVAGWYFRSRRKP